MSHTKGPWKVVNGSQIYELHISCCSDVPTKEGAIAFFGETGPRGEERKANANLIAAAPEMLEALDQAREVFNNLDGDKLSRSDNREIERALAYIEDAIAKARGES